MQRLTLMLLSTVCLLGLAAPALAANSGVTAAVNQAAHATAPGGAVRTIVIGDNVVTNEKIDTDGAGLVQILLPDGTTFTVGPNSSLIIDKFVYDPDANTAQVTASIARGVFRFIGGRTSKTPDGVTLNTPVGTVGIRGAVVDLSFTPNGKQIQAQIDMLFGNEVTLSGHGSTLQRLYQAGYSIIIGHDGNLQLVKTPPGSTNLIQQLLAGRPGTHGGSPGHPTDEKVASSDTHKTNSDVPPGQNTPGYVPPDLGAIQYASPDLTQGHDEAQNLHGGQDDDGGDGGDGGVEVHGFSAGFVLGYAPGEEGTYPYGPQIVRSTVGDVADNFITIGDDEDITAQFKEHGEGDFTVAELTGQFQLDANATASVTYAGGEPHSIPVEEPELDLTGTLCDCNFIGWGAWGLQSTGDDDTSLQSISLFAAGDIPTNTEFDNYVLSPSTNSEVSYSGGALGLLSGEDIPITGTMHMSYDLGARSGNLGVHFSAGSPNPILGEGDLNLSTAINGQNSGPLFSGSTGGFNVDGSFVKAGSDAAAGVMGSWSGTYGEGSAPVTGVFGGMRDTPQ
jgi:hypothetical protein